MSFSSFAVLAKTRKSAKIRKSAKMVPKPRYKQAITAKRCQNDTNTGKTAKYPPFGKTLCQSHVFLAILLAKVPKCVKMRVLILMCTRE